MSENDFNATHPTEGNLGRDGRVPPPSGVNPIGTPAGMPVSDPPETTDPIVPPGLIDPPLGGRAGVSGDPLSGTDEDSRARKAQEVKDEARGLAQDGKESARHVGQAAKREAGSVLQDAKEQSKTLLDELSSDVKAQSAIQQEKASTNLRQISDELRSMAQSSDSSGTASGLVDQAARYSGNAADWLANKEPGDLLGEVKDFARRRPGAFLGIALGAGLLVGRITRNAGSGPDASDKAGTTTPRIAATGEPRVPNPLPPTVNQTIGSGGVGGTGIDPGVDYDLPTVRRNEQGFSGS